jgi:hypothetical protein
MKTKISPIIATLLAIGALAFCAHAQSYPPGTTIAVTPQGQTVVTLPPGTSLPALTNWTVTAPATAPITPPTVQSFLSTAFDYVSSINTNFHTFDGNRGTLWTGAAYVQGQTFANALAAEYNIKTNGSFYVQSITLNAGIAGTILGQELNIGYHVVKKYDVDLSMGLGGAFLRDPDKIQSDSLKPGGDVYAQVLKGLAQKSFAGFRIEEDFAGKKLGAPLVYAIVGCVF